MSSVTNIESVVVGGSIFTGSSNTSEECILANIVVGGSIFTGYSNMINPIEAIQQVV